MAGPPAAWRNAASIAIYVACWSACTVLDKKTLDSLAESGRLGSASEAVLGAAAFATALLTMLVMARTNLPAGTTIAEIVSACRQSSLFTASCAATAAGYVTYFLILRDNTVFVLTILGPIIEAIACLLSVVVYGDQINALQLAGVVMAFAGSMVFAVGSSGNDDDISNMNNEM
jgi:drug/metabolite transporter (DMT)-like permease